MNLENPDHASPKGDKKVKRTGSSAKPSGSSGHEHNSHLLLNKIGDRGLIVSASQPAKVASCKNQNRLLEDQLARVFLGIVLVFVFCHTLRGVLALHEMYTFGDTVNCHRIGMSSFPFWAMVTTQVSHVLLVINSSVNIAIYCALSPRLRELFYQRFRAWGLVCRKRRDRPESRILMEKMDDAKNVELLPKVTTPCMLRESPGLEQPVINAVVVIKNIEIDVDDHDTDVVEKDDNNDAVGENGEDQSNGAIQEHADDIVVISVERIVYKKNKT